MPVSLPKCWLNVNLQKKISTNQSSAEKNSSTKFGNGDETPDRQLANKSGAWALASTGLVSASPWTMNTQMLSSKSLSGSTTMGLYTEVNDSLTGTLNLKQPYQIWKLRVPKKMANYGTFVIHWQKMSKPKIVYLIWSSPQHGPKPCWVIQPSRYTRMMRDTKI